MTLLEAEGLPLSIIKGCVPVDGDTYDVPRQIATVEARRAGIYRKKFGDEASQKALSPVTHAAQAAAQVAAGKHAKDIPLFLILHVADYPETTLQSKLLVAALKRSGVSASAFSAEGKNHGTINSELGQPGDKPTKALFDFVDRALRAE